MVRGIEAASHQPFLVPDGLAREILLQPVADLSPGRLGQSQIECFALKRYRLLETVVLCMCGCQDLEIKTMTPVPDQFSCSFSQSHGCLSIL